MSSALMIIGSAGFVSFFLTLLAVPLVKRLSIERGVLDWPDERRINSVPVPRMGGIGMGIGIAGAMLIVLFLDALLEMDLFSEANGKDFNFYTMVIGILLLFMLGLVDDILTLPASLKLMGQIIATSFIAASGALISELIVGSTLVSLGIWSYPLTVFYLVAITNAINLLDGLDGLATGVAVLTAGFVFALSLSTANALSGALSLIVLGSCVAFLFYNKYPASIFMGDSGAMTLGALLGLSILLLLQGDFSVKTFIAPHFALVIPIVDTLCAIVRRIRGGVSVGSADTSHIHHRLLYRFGHRKAVLVVYALSVGAAMLGVIFFVGNELLAWVAVILTVVLACFLIAKLRLTSGL